MAASASIHFTVDSHLLLELGERLVARRSIAVAELVKNSYDADATKVVVKLDNVAKIGGTIVVEDDGLGMTLDMLMDGWMRIATGAKRKDPISRKYKRIRTGAKGIGRFACRVLSDRLVLESVAIVSSGRKERVVATFEWARFKSGSKVDEITIPYRREQVEYDTPTGTRLVLENTREAWAEKDVTELQRDLLSLVSDFAPEVRGEKTRGKDPGFQIVIQAPEFPEFEGPVSEQFLQFSWCRLIGRASQNGKATYTLQFRKLKRERPHFTHSRVYDELGEAFFRIDFFVYRREYFAGLPISLTDARNIGRERGGVKIFLDRFRIFPYGEPTDDWLNLDKDKSRRATAFQEITETDDDLARPMLFLPGNNQLFGAVFLSRMKNPSITLTVTRDRLLANAAFEQLRSFVRAGIEWMTVQYARYGEESRGELPSRKDPLRPLEIARSKVLRSKDDLGPEATTEIVQAIEMARQAFEQREKESISELSMLRVLATTGTLVSVFEHELSIMIRGLRRETRNLLNLLEGIPSEYRSRLLESSTRLEDWGESVEESASQLGRMLGRESRDRLRSYPLKALIDEMIAPFRAHLDETHIDFSDGDLPSHLRLPPMFRCEVYSIFLNLITNSIKAVKPSKIRKIAITGESVGKGLRILILDTGRGIPPDRREEVFKPFVSDSEPDPLLGEGTGLGLTIVRNTVETYGGTVCFVDPPDGWNCCVELVFPED